MMTWRIAIQSALWRQGEHNTRRSRHKDAIAIGGIVTSKIADVVRFSSDGPV
jgi:hypothetical protein